MQENKRKKFKWGLVIIVLLTGAWLYWDHYRSMDMAIFEADRIVVTDLKTDEQYETTGSELFGEHNGAVVIPRKDVDLKDMTSRYQLEVYYNGRKHRTFYLMTGTENEGTEQLGMVNGEYCILRIRQEYWLTNANVWSKFERIVNGES